MVQSIEDSPLYNISNWINRRRSQTSILYIKLPGFFCWKAIYETAYEDLHKRALELIGTFSRMPV